MIYSILTLLMIIAGTCGLVSFVYFCIYRMRENENKEKLYKAVYFSSMIIFSFAGVLYLLARTYLTP